jgi:demethylmenaquinone methyltransferase / 2-methoxy-6-polyprenyl-1,4-benzoquinol methylase
MNDKSGEDAVSFGFETVSPTEKAERVKAVFSSVASRYDMMNDLMSAGVHRVWKANMIAWLNPQRSERMLDVAGGTGDVARAFLRRANAGRRRTTPAAIAVVADINEAMLSAGRRPSDDQLVRVACDAARLPFPDRSFDALAISFGIRNVVEMDLALREFRRVLKPGGRFACLEFSQMTHALLQEIYDRYSFSVIPALGEMVAGDRASYRYLVESIRRFPDQQTFAARIEAAGFRQVRWANYSAGVAALHTGWAV